MAKRTDNIITSGHTGRFGKFVFTSNDIVRSRPDFSKRVFSPAQIAHFTQWEQAIAFGRRAIRDPGLNDYYAKKAEQKKGLGAWHLAIKNYFEMPGIYSVHMGTRWNHDRVELEILSRGIYKLKELKITFSKPDGSILEEGPADLPDDDLFWYYPLQNEASATMGNLITFSGCSLPGHIFRNTMTIRNDFPFEAIVENDKISQTAKKNRKLKSQLRTD